MKPFLYNAKKNLVSPLMNRFFKISFAYALLPLTTKL